MITQMDQKRRSSGSLFCQECQNSTGHYWLFNGGVPYWIMITAYYIYNIWSSIWLLYNRFSSIWLSNYSLCILYFGILMTIINNHSIVKMILSHIETIPYHAVAIWIFRQTKVLKKPITSRYQIYLW